MSENDGQSSVDTDRPDDWPESFSLAGEDPSCPHQMTWDGSLYRCIYECGRTAEEPPERSIQAKRERNARSDDTGTDHSEESDDA